jgi:hypothetical protein
VNISHRTTEHNGNEMINAPIRFDPIPDHTPLLDGFLHKGNEFPTSFASPHIPHIKYFLQHLHSLAYNSFVIFFIFIFEFFSLRYIPFPIYTYSHLGLHELDIFFTTFLFCNYRLFTYTFVYLLSIFRFLIFIQHMEDG